MCLVLRHSASKQQSRETKVHASYHYTGLPCSFTWHPNPIHTHVFLFINPANSSKGLKTQLDQGLLPTRSIHLSFYFLKLKEWQKLAKTMNLSSIWTYFFCSSFIFWDSEPTKISPEFPVTLGTVTCTFVIWHQSQL